MQWNHPQQQESFLLPRCCARTPALYTFANAGLPQPGHVTWAGTAQPEALFEFGYVEPLRATHEETSLI